VYLFNVVWNQVITMMFAEVKGLSRYLKLVIRISFVRFGLNIWSVGTILTNFSWFIQQCKFVTLETIEKESKNNLP